MVISPSKKENHILNYIEYNAKREDWLLLTYEKIIDKFSDRDYEEEEIREILDDLESKKLVEIKQLDFEIYCTKGLSKKVDKKLKDYTRPNNIWFYLLGFISWVLLLKTDKVLDWVQNTILNGSRDIYTVILNGFLISFFAIWLIKSLFSKVYTILKERIPLIKQYFWITYPYILFGAVSIILIWVLGLSREIAVTITITGGSGALGVLYLLRRDKLAKKF